MSADPVTLTYAIKTTWDSVAVEHDPVRVSLTSRPGGVQMKVTAPFFNDSALPDGAAGQPVWQLWNHEVVEAFFLGDNDRYLEVELSPHGQHLLLFLNGIHNCIKAKLPLQFEVEAGKEESKEWKGSAFIPAGYFPPRVAKFNAYAIHGPEERRSYLALFPAPTGQHSQPDFHRLEYFQPIPFQQLLPSNSSPAPSSDWQGAMDNPSC